MSDNGTEDRECITWHCGMGCGNQMIATMFKGIENKFKCKECGSWWSWKWDGEKFRGELKAIDV